MAQQIIQRIGPLIGRFVNPTSVRPPLSRRSLQKRDVQRVDFTNQAQEFFYRIFELNDRLNDF
ncbi:hypothetical protein TcasGA2_TC031164 [Tribolium castaneum]|uniref:Uncharacterized protein n=1 Tax=Tribolium castaneum TaxID=7070 RepID=A0A139W9K5_TRICA|nr:hypothetical protein TcasGA2_TC031164 [Tribolium castaneum]